MISNKYGKPNMTSMPSELGIRIFKQILRTPTPDYKRLVKKADKLEEKMIEAQKKHE